ncbi:MAG: FecR domain-containing protein [Proteobacteria bacterium]|nr:FecR domain-containing protein [Pseudomonadota bacterium]
MPWIAIAATIVASVGASIFLGRMQRESDFRTAIGEQRSVSLSDGSLIFLNTDTEVRTDWTRAERRITLERGEARFQVAKDQHRPFTVITRDAMIRALGTVFNVRAKSGATEITVVEGRVSVAGESAGSALNAPRLELAAGDRASVDVGGQIRPNIGPPIERVSAWIERRLVFRGDPLSSVVAEFNRYRVKPLVIDDRELAKLQISGVFDSSDPDSLLAYLSSFEAVAIERPGDGTLHLARTPGSSTQNN